MNPLLRSLLAAGVLSTAACAGASEPPAVVPPPKVDESSKVVHSETAVLAGGCFWGVQGVFEHVKGVTRAVSGYAGGLARTAHYDEVSDGDTGHAESVQVTYDPTQISYGQLLQIYFSVAHDPTELNRQGPDSGTQYRSTIFAATPEQQQVAQAYIAQLNGANVFGKPLATTVENLNGFYPAEAYHQDYLVQNPHSFYIMVNDQPKIANLAKLFADRYRENPVLVSN